MGELNSYGYLIKPNVINIDRYGNLIKLAVFFFTKDANVCMYLDNWVVFLKIDSSVAYFQVRLVLLDLVGVVLHR